MGGAWFTVLAGRPRLARTRLVGKRLPIGPKPDFARLESAWWGWTAWTTWTRTTGPTAIAARAARTSGAIATFAAIAARSATATASSAAAKVARRRSELPPDPCARHLATVGPIVFLGFVLRSAEFETPETAWFVSSTTGTTKCTATAAHTAAPTTIAPTAASAAIVAFGSRSAGDPVDHKMELAARHRAMRPLLALVHPNKPHLIERVADDVECLEQTRCSIGLQR